MRKIFLFLFCCIPVMEVCSCSDYEEYLPEEDVLQERQMSLRRLMKSCWMQCSMNRPSLGCICWVILTDWRIFKRFTTIWC